MNEEIISIIIFEYKTNNLFGLCIVFYANFSQWNFNGGKKKKGEETVEKWIIHQSMNSNNSIYDMRSRVKRYERWERPFLSITLFMTIYANSHKKKKKMLESSYFFSSEIIVDILCPRIHRCLFVRVTDDKHSKLKRTRE